MKSSLIIELPLIIAGHGQIRNSTYPYADFNDDYNLFYPNI
jgi:hypothetical protein